jgi:hypothetical protein
MANKRFKPTVRRFLTERPRLNRSVRLTANFTKGNGLELPFRTGPEQRADSVRGADA